MQARRVFPNHARGGRDGHKAIPVVARRIMFGKLDAAPIIGSLPVTCFASFDGHRRAAA